MTTRRGVSAVVAMLLSAGWLLGAPGAAFAVKERQPVWLGSCGSGTQIGKVVIKDLPTGGVKVKVRIKNGWPNESPWVEWRAQDGPGSCDLGSDIYFLGRITTDAAGKGRFVIELPGGNPFPGKFVTIFMDGHSSGYIAPFDNVFQ